MIKLYTSDKPIWWNKGNEVKPTKADFKRITWTAATNFNVSWINEMLVSIIVPLTETFDLIKITNADAENPWDKERYYYLVGVNDKTKVNKECIFELDLWTTFILSDVNQKVFKLPAWSNMMAKQEYLDNIAAQGVSSNVLPTIPGLVNKNKTLSSVNVNTTMQFLGVANAGDKLYGLFEKLLNNASYKVNSLWFTGSNRIRDGWPVIYFNEASRPKKFIDGMLYYVFKLQHKYLIVPALYYEDVELTEAAIKARDDNDNDVMYFVSKLMLNNNNVVGIQCNNTSYRIAFTLINYYSNWRVEGSNLQLGQFVGTFIGPSCALINKKPVLIRDVADTAANRLMSAGLDINGIFKKGYPILHTTLFNPNNGKRWGKFIGWEVSELGVDLINDFNYQKEYISNYLRGLNQFNNENANTLAKAWKMFYTNQLVLTDGNETVELMSELPTFTDAYAIKVNNQMNTYNTSWGLTNFNAVKSGLLGAAMAGFGAYTPASSWSRTITDTGYRDALSKGYSITHSKKKKHAAKRGEKKNFDWYMDVETVPDQIHRLNSSKTHSISSTRPATFNMIGAATGIGTSLLDMGIQLATNYFERKAMYEDMRNTLSTTTTTTVSFMLNFFSAITHKAPYNVSIDSSDFAHINNFPVASFYGYERTEQDYWFNLYGCETNFYKLDNDIYNVNAYENKTLRIPENFRSLFLMQTTNVINPIIRDAIWQMLNQGVVVMSRAKLKEITGEPADPGGRDEK